uniref:DNA 3'-5' helicase n=1 Tax=uncultured Candidatus Melainabacteria bacterium TaxID=2682970 RepID=A0A650EL20_9BACT|nr:hypothetical protein Melaina855_0110 [uncultured Candidatus Melainabacteria bacterium]
MNFTPNEKQQECIDNITGKYLVLAGPGTGKTFTIIERIKSMLSQGINPEKILCLTFTEAAANEMKSRLDKSLGKLDCGVNIYTYHGFCNEIINENPTEFELPQDYKIITEAVSRTLLKECIDEINPIAYRTNKNDPYYYIKEISELIKEIKKNRLTKEKFFENIEKNPDWKPRLSELKNKLEEKNKKGDTRTKTLIDDISSLEKKIAKITELWNFYECYKAKMEAEHYLDFDDMISFVLDKFENEPGFVSQVANKYEYLLVDEYQDTNKSQNEIVFHLTKSLNSENVFVVGDDDQIIFSFQGAKLDTIEKFLQEFPDTQVICLTENMRSTQSILDASREITKQDSHSLEANPDFVQYNITKNLTAKNEKIILKDNKVRCYKYADILQEYNEIVNEIESIINSPNCPIKENGEKDLSQIAILTKNNSELSTFAEILKEHNIPSELKEGKNIFEIKSSTVLYYYLQMLVNPELHSDKVFKLLLSQPFNLAPKDFETIYNKYYQHKSLIDTIKSIHSEQFTEPEKIKNFITTFDYLTYFKTNETLKNVILETGTKTGIFNYYLTSEINKCENIAGLKKLVDEAVDFAQVHKKISLEDFIEYIDMTIKEDIPIKTDKAPIPMNAIQLSTYHSAKGREFEYVYMPTLIRDNWESDRKTLKPAIPLDISEYKTDEELKSLKRSDKIKLMYVGMTRAKHTLRLSYPEKIGTSSKIPTEFIVNIQDILEKESEPFIYDINSFWQERTKSLFKRDYDYNRDFCSMVDARILGKSFSPTSINTYLNCPRQYLYDYALGLKAKDGNPDNLSYGSAVHKALEFAIKTAIETGKYPTEQEILNVFTNKLETLPLSAYEQKEILQTRGKNALNAYYPQICNTPVSMLYAVEQSVKFDVDGVKFYGIIDRLDKNPDGTYTIYDYKTGNAKSSRSICPDGEYEKYYNQIGLYKYYFEKSTGYKVKETTFIFPEDFTKNLTLNLTDNECQEIEDKFKTAITDIKSYKFEPTYKKETCKHCQYKDFCNMEII